MGCTAIGVMNVPFSALYDTSGAPIEVDVLDVGNALLFSGEQLEQTPSRREGYSATVEAQLRLKACEVVHGVLTLCAVDRTVICTALVYLQRYYCQRSIAAFHFKYVALGVSYLALKTEETNLTEEELIPVFCRFLERAYLPEGQKGEALDWVTTRCSEYELWWEWLVCLEMDILIAFGFKLHVAQPHKLMFTYLQKLELVEFMQACWEVLNDSYLTTACLRYKSEVLACGAIFYVTQKAKVALPVEGRYAWWELFGATERELCAFALMMHELYHRPEADFDFTAELPIEYKNERPDGVKKPHPVLLYPPRDETPPVQPPVDNRTPDRERTAELPRRERRRSRTLSSIAPGLRTTMTSKKTSYLVSSVLLCLLLACFAREASAKEVFDRKLAKIPRPPKHPLFEKIKDVVSPRKHKGAKDEVVVPVVDAFMMAPEVEPMVELDPMPSVEVEPKATGVRVTPTRRPPPEAAPKVTAPRAVPPECVDTPPDSVYTCAEQRAFGKCDAEFMVKRNYCARTCGRPPCPPVMTAPEVCDDRAPSPDYSCAEQRAFGKCDAEFMVKGNYCARSCGRAPCPPIDTTCTTISAGVEGSPLLAVLDLALEVTNLKRLFDDPSLRVTVFAPTNVAFEDLLSDLDVSAEQLLSFPAVVEEILGAHVLVEPVLSSDLEDGAMFEAMSDMSDVEIAFVDEDVLVIPDYGLPAAVVSTDLDACGSIVHVIDTVLIPDREILLALGLPPAIIANYEAM